MDPREFIVGNLNGYLLEPVNPSYAVSSKYFFDDDTRKELLGTLSTSPKLDKFLIDRLKREFTERNYTSALRGVKEMEKEYKLQIKEKKRKEKLFDRLGAKKYDKEMVKRRKYIY